MKINNKNINKMKRTKIWALTMPFDQKSLIARLEEDAHALQIYHFNTALSSRFHCVRKHCRLMSLTLHYLFLHEEGELGGAMRFLFTCFSIGGNEDKPVLFWMLVVLFELQTAILISLIFCCIIFLTLTFDKSALFMISTKSG